MKKNRYIDAHLHLQDNRLNGVREDFIDNAAAHGVEVLICNAAQEDEWPHLTELSNKHAAVKPYYGVHPWYSGAVKEGWLERLAELIRGGVGIGEVGLDRYAKIDIQTQEQVFTSQLDLVKQLHIPVTIHCIKCWGRLLDILQSYNLADSGLLLHSFGGSKEVLFRLLDLGAYFSFSTCLANPARVKLREVFMDVPLGRILLETDSPDQYCAYLQENGTLDDETILNEPAQVVKLYEFAAQIKKVDPDLLRENIWKNGQVFTR